jgi:predicted acylesterase/phospholipase RssA
LFKLLYFFKARSGSLLALSPNFDVLALVRQGLEDALPENARLFYFFVKTYNYIYIDILCTGRLYISATRARDYKNEIISEFSTRKELIEAILCSCFIPFYCGTTPPTYRGEQYIDGAFSDNQPGKWEQDTITVKIFLN